MKFDWLKKLFKKKIKENNKTSDVSTIDTSLVYVPKFEELTKEAQDEVLKELEALNKDDKEYEKLLKYTSELDNVSNRERSVLTKTLERYHQWYGRKSSKKDGIGFSERICYGLLSNLELKEIIKNMQDVGKKLTIKAVALDLYIEQKERERKPLRQLFKHAERIEYQNLRTRLLGAKERIRVSIKINEQILRTVYIDINENDTLQTEYNYLKQLLCNSTEEQNSYYKSTIKEPLNSILWHYSHDFIGTGFDDTFVTKLKAFTHKLVGEKAPEGFSKKHNCYYSLSNVTVITEEVVDKVEHLALDGGEDYTFNPLLDLIPDHMFEEFFILIANIMHSMEEYRFDHKEDYKTYIEEMRKIVEELENKPTKKWKKSKLEEQTRKYDYGIYCYLKLLREYIDSDKIRNLKEAYIKLLFLCKLKNDNLYNIYGWLGTFYTALDKLSMELLSKVEEKYGIAAAQDEESRDKFIRSYDDDYFIFLYDLLQGNTNVLNTTISLKTENDSAKKQVDEFAKDKKYYVSTDEEFSVEDLIHTMSLLGYDNESLISKIATSGDNFLTGYEAIDTDFAKFITKIKIHDLINKQDGRIVILPKQVRLYAENAPDLRKQISNIDELDASFYCVALYVTTAQQLEALLKIRNRKNSSDIKYIYVNESVLEEYKEKFIREYQPKMSKLVDLTKESIEEFRKKWAMEEFERLISNDNSSVKLIPVLRDTEYSELSNILDHELYYFNPERDTNKPRTRVREKEDE